MPKNLKDLNTNLAPMLRHYKTLVDVAEFLQEVGGIEQMYNEASNRLAKAKGEMSAIDKDLPVKKQAYEQVTTRLAALEKEIEDRTHAAEGEAKDAADKVISNARDNADDIIAEAKQKSAEIIKQRSDENQLHADGIKEKLEAKRQLDLDIEAKKKELTDTHANLKKAKDQVADIFGQFKKAE